MKKRDIINASIFVILGITFLAISNSVEKKTKILCIVLGILSLMYGIYKFYKISITTDEQYKLQDCIIEQSNQIDGRCCQNCLIGQERSYRGQIKDGKCVETPNQFNIEN